MGTDYYWPSHKLTIIWWIYGCDSFLSIVSPKWFTSAHVPRRLQQTSTPSSLCTIYFEYKARLQSLFQTEIQGSLGASGHIFSRFAEWIFGWTPCSSHKLTDRVRSQYTCSRTTSSHSRSPSSCLEQISQYCWVGSEQCSECINWILRIYPERSLNTDITVILGCFSR